MARSMRRCATSLHEVCRWDIAELLIGRRLARPEAATIDRAKVAMLAVGKQKASA